MDDFENVHLAAIISEVLARLDKWAKANLQPAAPVKRIASQYFKQMTEDAIISCDKYDLVEKMVVKYNIATLKSKKIHKEQNKLVAEYDGKLFSFVT